MRTKYGSHKVLVTIYRYVSKLKLETETKSTRFKPGNKIFDIYMKANVAKLLIFCSRIAYILKNIRHNYIILFSPSPFPQRIGDLPRMSTKHFASTFIVQIAMQFHDKYE